MALTPAFLGLNFASLVGRSARCARFLLGRLVQPRSAGRFGHHPKAVWQVLRRILSGLPSHSQRATSYDLQNKPRAEVKLVSSLLSVLLS
jgi:hypothetical protein